jgi:hypothetical protein
MNFHIITIFLNFIDSRPHQRRTDLVSELFLYLFGEIEVRVALYSPLFTGLI